MKRLLSLTRSAVDDYSMIDDGDKVCVGLSGGKDSLSTLYILAELRKFYPKKFELCAVTIDMGFKGMDFSKVLELCQSLSVEYVIKTTEISKVVFEYRNESNPCSLCAKMRRGALNEAAKELSCNKVALGHHKDDVIETFFLSLFYEGRINCFSPVTYLSRTDITQIRPLIYIPELTLSSFANTQNLPVVYNPCPANGKTRRQYIKEHISSLKKVDPQVAERIFHAIRHSNISGWNPDSDSSSDIPNIKL